MEYVYYSFKTGGVTEKWSTSVIEDFLLGFGMTKEEGGESFLLRKPFLSVLPLNVRDYNSWNETDYDPQKTNYISVVTTDEYYWGVNKNGQIKSILEGLEDLLQTNMQEE